MEMKREKITNIKYVIPILWFFFFLFLLIQYRYVYLYYDDFGYCSLSYGYNAEIDGTAMGLPDIFRYLFHSYFQVNGRIFTNFLLVVAAWSGGLEAMRIILPLCILAVYWMIYQLIKRPEMKSGTKIVITIYLCFSYGTFSLSVCRYGLYWFAAAFGYVVPMLLFLLFCNIYRNGGKILPVIAFILCISSEQIVAMVIMYIMVNNILLFLSTKNLDTIYIITTLSAIVSSLLMISSPASQGRMISENNIEFYNRSFCDKIFYNSDKIVKLFFEETGIVFGLMLLFYFLFLSIQLTKYGERFKVVHILWGLCTFLVIFLFLGNLSSPGITLEEKTHLLFLYFIFSFGEIFLYYYINDHNKIGLVIAAVSSIGILLFVPEIPIRTFIPFIFMCILLMADIISEKKDILIFICCLMTPYALISFVNLKRIYNGYKKNSIVLDYNHCKLKEAGDKLKNGETVNVVELYKMIDESYAGQQVYDINVSYMKFWIDEYYSLPYDVEYVYYDYPTGNNPVSICHVK